MNVSQAATADGLHHSIVRYFFSFTVPCRAAFLPSRQHTGNCIRVVATSSSSLIRCMAACSESFGGAIYIKPYFVNKVNRLELNPRFFLLPLLLRMPIYCVPPCRQRHQKYVSLIDTYRKEEALAPLHQENWKFLFCTFLSRYFFAFFMEKKHIKVQDKHFPGFLMLFTIRTTRLRDPAPNGDHLKSVVLLWQRCHPIYYSSSISMSFFFLLVKHRTRTHILGAVFTLEPTAAFTHALTI